VKLSRHWDRFGLIRHSFSNRDIDDHQERQQGNQRAMEADDGGSATISRQTVRMNTIRTRFQRLAPRIAPHDKLTATSLVCNAGDGVAAAFPGCVTAPPRFNVPVTS
jgi:hypothetical protein